MFDNHNHNQPLWSEINAFFEPWYWRLICLFLGKSPHTLPVTIQKTGQAVVIGLGEKDAVAGQVSKAVGKIADYIESVGY